MERPSGNNTKKPYRDCMAASLHPSSVMDMFWPCCSSSLSSSFTRTSSAASILVCRAVAPVQTCHCQPQSQQYRLSGKPRVMLTCNLVVWPHGVHPCHKERTVDSIERNARHGNPAQQAHIPCLFLSRRDFVVVYCTCAGKTLGPLGRACQCALPL